MFFFDFWNMAFKYVDKIKLSMIVFTVLVDNHERTSVFLLVMWIC